MAPLVIRLVPRNLARYPLRTGLTIGAVAIAILAFATLRALVDSWYARADASSATRLIVRNATSLTFRLPISYRVRIAQVQGVTLVSHATWFGGIYQETRNAFPQFAVDAESYLRLHPEYLMSADETAAFLRDRNAAIAGSEVAAKYGWEIGDIIALTGNRYPGDWEFVLRGIYEGAEEHTDERMLLFHWSALNEQLRRSRPVLADQVGAFVIGIEHADEAARVADEIDRQFANSLARTLTETQRAFQLGFIAMSQGIVQVIRTIGYVVVGIVLAVVTNAMAMSVRERMREFATLKALGFGPRHLVLLILSESVVITVAGGVLGTLATFPTVQVLQSLLGDGFPLSALSQTSLWLSGAMALLVGLVAGLMPAARIAALPVTDGLRGSG